MATLNYNKRLANLQERKFDRELNESVFSKSASASLLPENIKYLIESMRPIDSKYNDKTIDAAGRVKKHMEEGLSLHFSRAYKTQGSVMTRTNIKVHSDFDLLAIIDRYQYLEPGVTPPNPYTATCPDDDILDLRTQTTKILKSVYDEVDDSGEKSISVFNKSLKRKIDVVFCFWCDTNKYREEKNEYYRGIYLYEFSNKKKILDYPFAHLSQVNTKGEATLDGSRRGIRLLKTLRADSETILKKLNSFILTSVVHSIEDHKIKYLNGNELNIAKTIAEQLDRLLQNPDYRRSIKSPNGAENPLHDDSLVVELSMLKQDLDLVIQDSEKEIVRSGVIKTAMASY